MSQSFLEKVNEVLESEIRPILKNDGGDIVASSFENGIVYVELKGVCACCSRGQETMSGMIEPILKTNFPEITAVVRL